MAIENELKYVLMSVDDKYFEKFCGTPVLIEQGYLPGKARIRKKKSGKKETYYFTYKLAVDDVIFEIEKKITTHEYETLWKHTERRLTKLRYLFKDGVVQWDIDRFFFDEKQYFVMAEAEMPEDMKEPQRVPKFLTDVLIYAVPRQESKEFTSSRVSDPSYARSLMNRFIVDEIKLRATV